MPSSPILILLAALAVVLVGVVGFLAYVLVRYTPIIGRIFEEKPMFLPLRVPPVAGGEEVRFPTTDGLELAGTFFHARTPDRAGVIVFCHEFLGDRWSFAPYADHLRDLGFDLFTFDFRNHGESAPDPVYRPLQWVTDHEVRDLRAAIEYLRTRPDVDPAGLGLFGISRGGGTALCVASKCAGVWGVVTDGAFSTRGTMLAYILRWAEIYVGSQSIYHRLPPWFFALVCWATRIRSERRLHCRFPDMERAVARIGPRPWLMIHGAKDAYIGPEIAKGLFAKAVDPKDSWIVPNAKHNRCRELEPEAYRERISDFFGKYSPRRPTPPIVVPGRQPEDDAVPASTVAETIAAPVSG